jgi:hypothetical protein
MSSWRKGGSEPNEWQTQKSKRWNKPEKKEKKAKQTQQQIDDVKYCCDSRKGQKEDLLCFAQYMGGSRFVNLEKGSFTSSQCLHMAGDLYPEDVDSWSDAWLVEAEEWRVKNAPDSLPINTTVYPNLLVSTKNLGEPVFIGRTLIWFADTRVSNVIMGKTVNGMELKDVDGNKIDPPFKGPDIEAFIQYFKFNEARDSVYSDTDLLILDDFCEADVIQRFLMFSGDADYPKVSHVNDRRRKTRVSFKTHRDMLAAYMLTMKMHVSRDGNPFVVNVKRCRN